MKPVLCFTVAVAMLALSARAAAPRVMFVRTVSPPHDLHTDGDVALIYAIGDNEKISTFLEVFVDHASRTLRIDNLVSAGPHLVGNRPDDATLRALRRRHPAAFYLGINLFSCSAEERSAEGSEHDVDGGRVKRRHVWADVTCTARVDVMNGTTGDRIESFPVRGEGTSPRVAELTDEERNVAYEQAARYAALAAQEAITPRRVRESIELDDTAPAFEEGMSMIEAGRLREARLRWEKALLNHRDSASLEYNIAAVCEAMSDNTAARAHFERAAELSPGERRFRKELRSFLKRNNL